MNTVAARRAAQNVYSDDFGNIDDMSLIIGSGGLPVTPVERCAFNHPCIYNRRVVSSAERSPTNAPFPMFPPCNHHNQRTIIESSLPASRPVVVHPNNIHNRSNLAPSTNTALPITATARHNATSRTVSEIPIVSRTRGILAPTTALRALRRATAASRTFLHLVSAQ